jgi:ribosomal protein L32E
VNKKGDKIEHENGYDKTTKVKAYSPSDSYDDIVAGKTDVDDFDTKASACNVCGLIARNDRELQDHVSNAHTNQPNSG